MRVCFYLFGALHVSPHLRLSCYQGVKCDDQKGTGPFVGETRNRVKCDSAQGPYPQKVHKPE
jgi:hypothetical protein